MNPFEMVLGIVIVVSIASVLRHRHRAVAPAPRDQADTNELRAELRQLRDRVQVLEAIVTDGDRNRGLALEREIERLRDTKTNRRDPNREEA